MARCPCEACEHAAAEARAARADRLRLLGEAALLIAVLLLIAITGANIVGGAAS